MQKTLLEKQLGTRKGAETVMMTVVMLQILILLLEKKNIITAKEVKAMRKEMIQKDCCCDAVDRFYAD